MMMAASHLDHQMLSLLLAKGADPLAVDSTYYDGYNAIFHAVKSDKNRERTTQALHGSLHACISYS